MPAIIPKRVIAVAGAPIEIARAGSGPSIVLINGAGGPIEGWMRVFDPLSALGTVLAYNRAGIGKTAKPATAQTGEFLVDELRAILVAESIPAPHVLVGHSLGGLLANLFARRSPESVSAVVFLDAATVEDVEVMPRLETGVQRFLGRLGKLVSPPNPLAETEQVGVTARQIKAAGPFPPIPVVMLSGGRPAMAWATRPEALAARQAHQRLLSELSPVGTRIVAEKSGHFPQFTEPTLVVDAVRKALVAAEKARANG